MELKITIDDESIAKLADAIAERIGGPRKKAAPAKVEPTGSREDLVAIINLKIKGVDASMGAANKDIIKAVLKEHGAAKVPEVAPNKIGAVIEAIEERCHG